jgi:hypothetical protein
MARKLLAWSQSEETKMATTMEVGKAIAELVKEEKYQEAMDRFYSPDIISTEAASPNSDSPITDKGISAIAEKVKQWESTMESHSVEVEGPFPCGDQFILGYKMDVTQKASGQRFVMKEMALYTVENDKIVDEKFFYHMG